jgi:squalene synthase HpnC
LTAAAPLRETDAYCRRLARAHYENFWVLSALPPGPLRRHVTRLYAFCRLTDDLGDESGEEATALLLGWQEQLREALAGNPDAHPVLAAVADSVRRLGLPGQPFFDLIAANLQDQRVHTYETWEELEAYCRLSAAPVGRLWLHIHGCWSPAAEALSDDVCIGLQLANFAQDVTVDAAKGRTYLLQRDLREVGTVGAVRRMCERARRLLASGLDLERMTPARLRLQLALYRLGGEAILKAIEREGCRTDVSRPALTNAQKLTLAGAALRRLARA